MRHLIAVGEAFWAWALFVPGVNLLTKDFGVAPAAAAIIAIAVFAGTVAVIVHKRKQ